MQSSDSKSVVQGLGGSPDENVRYTPSRADSESSTSTADSNSEDAKTGIRPELRDFINRAIVPILVEKYLAERATKKPTTQNPNTGNDTPIRRDFFTIQQLAGRWSCSRGMVYNVLRSTGTKVVDFAAKGRKGHKLIPVAAVEEIERRKLRPLR